MTSPFRPVTPDFWVSPQITAQDVAEAARQGVRLILNNRPDGEEPGQPAGAEIAAAAEAAGLGYAEVPIRGRPGPADIQAVRQAVAGANGPVLAYCRSGTRSIMTWALGEAMAGARTRQDLVEIGRRAGYDLSMFL